MIAREDAVRTPFLDGIVKEAASAWIKKLMAMSRPAQKQLLDNWDKTDDVVRLLGEGARGIAKDKAGYKIAANKARILLTKTMPKGQSWAGHGKKHIWDVVKNMQGFSGTGRKWLPNVKWKNVDKLTGKVTEGVGKWSHQARTTTAAQRRGTIAALLHDNAKAIEKATPKAVLENNFRRYHHSMNGARRAQRFMKNERFFFDRAGLAGKGQPFRSGQKEIVKAIRGHNPASWKQPGIAGVQAQAGAGTRTGALLRFADDTAGNIGPVGWQRTVTSKFTAPGGTAAQKVQAAKKYALEKNLPKYQQNLRDVEQAAQQGWIPEHMVDYSRGRLGSYYGAMDDTAAYVQRTGQIPTAATGFMDLNRQTPAGTSQLLASRGLRM